MRNLLRRIRGAIGMGLIWGAAWSVAGFLVAAAMRFRADAPFPIIFAVFGFFAGVIFSVILALIDGRRTLDQLSPRRFAGWGAVGGLLVSSFFAKAVSLGWGDVLMVVPTFALASAACAAGSLALATRATRRELPDSHHDRLEA